MKPSAIPKALFILIAIVAAMHFASLYAQLPETMASHFDGRGMPNGWQSKELFLVFLAAAFAVAAVLTFAVPRIIETLPIELINFPHKKYWLARSRRAESLAYCRTQFAWFGCALLLFMVLTFDFAVQANFRDRPRLDSSTFVVALIAFILFSIVFTVRMIKRFGSPPQTAAGPKTAPRPNENAPGTRRRS
jgi:uncharacterized membrane protein